MHRLTVTIVVLTPIALASVGVAGQEFSWARRVGGPSSDIAYAVGVDGAGNVIVAGDFSGTVDFDPGPGVANLTAAGSSDVFVLKLDADGNFVWIRQLSGPVAPSCRDLAVAATDAVYVTGSFSATLDADPGPGVATLSAVGLTDVFVVKLDAGGEWVWGRSWGGTAADAAQALAEDSDGNLYTVGFFQNSADFDPGPGVLDLTSAGSVDAFLSKLDDAGNFVWARRFGGFFVENALGVATAGDGDVLVLGGFQGIVDFDPGPGVSNLTSAGDTDAFVVRLDGNGDLVWARRQGGFTTEAPVDLRLDGSGNLFSVGYFGGTADFDPGPGVAELTSNGSADVYVSKLDANGDFLWARGFGGSGFDPVDAVVVAPNGHVFTGGNFASTVDFDPGTGVTDVTAIGNQPDAFVSELDALGNFVGVSVFSSSASEIVTDLATDAAGDVFAVGRFTGTTDFDPGPGVTNLTSSGASDAFVVRLGSPGPTPPDIFEIEIETTAARTVGVAGTDYAFGVFVVADANLTDVTVTPLGGQAFPLAYDPLDDVHFVVFEGYPSLAALRADFPIGDYRFEFNGGASSVELDYADFEPDCFADITSPAEACAVTPTPTFSWSLPPGCSGDAVDVGLDDSAADETLFELSFVPAASGSITLPDGPVAPPPLEPLPPQSPLVEGQRYGLGVDVVQGVLIGESLGADAFDYFSSFRKDQDLEFVVSSVVALVLSLEGDALEWSCAGPGAVGVDVVSGDLIALAANGDFASATSACIADDSAASFVADPSVPAPGAGIWYLVREVTAEGAGSYGSGGTAEVPGRDAEIAASGVDCP